MCTRSQKVKHYNSCIFQTAMHRKTAENIPLISAFRLQAKKISKKKINRQINNKKALII